MSSKRHSDTLSVRAQWTRQRKGTSSPAQVDSGASCGHHFSKCSASASPSSAQESSPFDHMEPSSRATETRHVKISGASGELPVVSHRLKISPASAYSRYSKRYVAVPGKETTTTPVFKSLFTEPVAGAPAYSWFPFAVCGAASVVSSLLWFLIAVVILKGTVGAGVTTLATGVAVLCITVVAGIVVTAVTVGLTVTRCDEVSHMDATASAFGKGGAVIAGSTLVWVVLMAFATPSAA